MEANWRTVLVAGLNAGGRGYYALDVTDPDNPKALWEIQGGVAAAMAFNAAGSPLRQVVISHANLPLGRERPVIEIWGRPSLVFA